MSTQNTKKERRPLPPEPPEVIAKRDKLLAELESQSKTAKGTFKEVVFTMKTLVSSTQPGTPFDEQLYGDVSGALNRFMKDPILPVPPVLGMVVEYLQTRLNTYGVTVQTAVKEMNPELHAKMAYTPPAGGAPSATPARPAAGAAPAAKDGFEGAPSKRLSLSPEANMPPPADAKQEQQNLESFKAWMKNPSLGKLKG